MPNAQNKKTAVIPLGGPSPAGPYSPGLLVGDTLYVSGQVALDPKTNAIVSDSFEEQAHQTFRNLQSVLAAAGASLRDVVKVSVFLTDITTLGAFNAIYKEQFSMPYPARSTVGVGKMPLGIQVEIDAIAIVPENG